MKSLLSSLLRLDLVDFLVSRAKFGRTPERAKQSELFPNPGALRDAIRSGLCADGDVVSVRAKSSGFGPYLRRHVLPMFSGNLTANRLGPPIVHKENSPIHQMMGMFANMQGLLIPVGLYPILPGGVIQGALYPPDANVFGFASNSPLIATFGIDRIIVSMPALFAPRHATKFHGEAVVTGTVRAVGVEEFAIDGLRIEDYEELRAAGATTFLDVTGDESSVECQPGKATGELWGSFYAAGHLEFDGRVKVAPLHQAVVEAFVRNGFSSPGLMHGEHAEGITSALISDRGIRLEFRHQPLGYALQMDVDIANDYGRARRSFDALCTDILSGFESAFRSESVALNNPADLDFTYTDAASSFRVLSSMSADSLADPLAIGIRNWHRRRNVAPLAGHGERMDEGERQLMSASVTEQAPIDVVVLTALREELDACLSLLPDVYELPVEAGTVLVGYRAAVAVRQQGRLPYNVVLAAIGMGRVKGAAGAAEALRRWPASTLVLVGIAGGIGDAKLGDIVVPDQIIDIAMEKQTEDGREPRYSAYPADSQLLAQAGAMRIAEWYRPDEAAEAQRQPEVHIAPIFSGDTVVAVEGWLTQDGKAWPKSVGVEMEAGGAAEVVHRERRRFLMVRGVSDRADANKDSATRDGWRQRARERAAAFVLGLLRRGAVV